ncbi:glycosyltransferase family 39 protein (plasmid) [Haloferacaceae archaeon DSL9]
MSDERGKAGDSPSAILDDGRYWLAAAVVAGAVIVAKYYLTHPYPAYATALFLHMAEILVENGYSRPETVPLYTADGLPFAYPPLMFYVMAFLIDIGIDPLQLSRLLPGVLYICALIPYFYLAREFLSVREAGFATVAFAVTPQLFRWHITGGGTVRAAGLLLTIAGLYVGVRLFRTGNWRLVLPGMLLYGLTMLTHPVFTAYFGISYLVFFIAFSRSPRGLVHGILVAVGGTIIGAPWWYYVSNTYGSETILNASTTHGGLGIGGMDLAAAEELIFGSGDQWVILTLISLVGAIYLLSRRRYAILAWFVATAVVIPQPRFRFIPGMMLISVLVAGEIVPKAVAAVSRDERPDGAFLAVFAVLIVSMTWFGGYSVTTDPLDEERSMMPAYVDDDDIAAMNWVANETPEDAQFVVIADQAEWFPYVADRTNLFGPWGVEWAPAETYEHHRTTHGQLANCNDAACVSGILDANDVEADYVYVPKGEYVYRGGIETQDAEMRSSFIASERYTLVYENDGAMVFRITS